MSNRQHRNTSLRLRLLVASLVTTVFALGVAGIGLTLLFERHLARTLDDELNVQLTQFAAHTEVDDSGKLILDPVYADPRFSQPLSGHYWQISEILSAGSAREAQQLTSRSLWDQTLSLPAEIAGNSTSQRVEIDGPDHSRLVALTRRIVLTDTADSPITLQLIVARDMAYLKDASGRFVQDLLPSLGLLGLVLVIAATIQVYVGLRPMEFLRREIHTIRRHESSRMPDNFPAEVQPLADELNSLLDAQDAALKRARERAADLAHGLMTPLTAMMATARRLREKKQHDLAADIEQLTEQMRLHVGREMARARIRTENQPNLATTGIPVADVAQRLFRTIQRTPAGERLSWEMEIPPDFLLPVEQHDLTELLGNLLDNAARHARSRVRLRAQQQPQVNSLIVEDDGPGIPARNRDSMLQRGVRLDSSLAAAGAGLGLSIVSRIIDAYAGKISLGDSPLGGLMVVITLDRQTAEAEP